MHLQHLALAFILPALAHAEAGKTLGCYSKFENVSSVLKFSYQSHDYCLDHCSKNKYPIAALTMGATCYCSTETPAESSKTDEEKCNRKCSGWPEDNCGGVDAYYVLTTGVDSGKSSSNNNSNSNSDPSSSADTNTKPAFKTIVVASTATASVNTGTDQAAVSTASTMAGGIVVAPHQSSMPAGAATSALKANATPMATNASGSAAAVTAGSTSTSASLFATPNAAGSLRAGSAAGFVVAGLGLLL